MLQDLVEKAGVDLFAVYAQLEKAASSATTKVWANAPRVGNTDLSEEAQAAIKSAESQLATDNPQKVVNGELRTKHRGASGFRKKRCCHRGAAGNGDEGELSEERVKQLYDAETPAAAAELGIEGEAEGRAGVWRGDAGEASLNRL